MNRANSDASSRRTRYPVLRCATRSRGVVSGFTLVNHREYARSVRYATATTAAITAIATTTVSGFGNPGAS